MSIQVGDVLPCVNLFRMESDGLTSVSTDELFKSKKVVLFAVPGAFTLTCSVKHLPGFVHYAEQITAKGVDLIVCLAVNDIFVMNAWGKEQNVEGKVLMLSDGDGVFTKAIGQEYNLQGKGFGMRSHRYAMIVEDGIVKFLAVDEPGKFEVSSAEKVLEKL
jgi:peroxiredoxin